MEGCCRLSSPSPDLQVQHAYLQRRKMLRKSLEGMYSRAQLDMAQQSLGPGLSLAARPQELAMPDLVQIFSTLQRVKQQSTPDGRQA